MLGGSPKQQFYSKVGGFITRSPILETLPSRTVMVIIQRALEDSNPRHQVLETCVLPTELRAPKLSSGSTLSFCIVILKLRCVNLRAVEAELALEGAVEALLNASRFTNAVA